MFLDSQKACRIAVAVRLTLSTLVIFLVTLGPSSAQEIVFPDFVSTAGLTLNGHALATGGNLRLASATQGQAGSAFWSEELTTHASFESRFQLQIIGPGPIELRSDGMAFVIHSDPRGDTALGMGGEALGYGALGGNPGAISPSVVIEFDIYRNADPDDRHIALTFDGDEATHVDFASTLIPIDDGAVKNAAIRYDSETDELSVWYSEEGQPLQLMFTQIVDLAARLGDSAYYGFSAGTGGGFADHDVLNWALSLQTSCSSLDVTGSGLPGTCVSFDLNGAPAKVPAFLLIAHEAGSTDIGFGSLGQLSLGVRPPWFLLPLGWTDAEGGASLDVPLPPWSLPPMEFFAQTSTLELQFPPLSLVFCTSNVVPFTVGDP